MRPSFGTLFSNIHDGIDSKAARLAFVVYWVQMITLGMYSRNFRWWKSPITINQCD